MIKTWGLTNFKSIYSMPNEKLELKPLTIMAGTNSSGKSSFIQSILLIIQTMKNPYKEYPLVLNGQYVNFGKFEDIMSFHEEDGKRKSVSVGIRWSCKYSSKRVKDKGKYYFSMLPELKDVDNPDECDYDAETEIEFDIEYDAYNNESNIKINRQIMPRLKSVKHKANTIVEAETDEDEDDEGVFLYKDTKGIHIKVCDKNPSEIPGGQKECYDIEYDSGEASGLRPMDAEFLHFFPMRVLNSLSARDGTIKNQWGSALGSIKSEKLLNELNENFSSKFIYIGPLREDPKQLYPFSEFSYMPNFGKKGENTAAILALNSNNSGTFPIPDWDDSGNYKSEEKTLKEAIIAWLEYIGVAEDIAVGVEPGGFTLKVKIPKSNHFNDLTNVGVGISQVVPVVVSCLFADKGSILVFEQPELHLHPKMQTRLAHFFVAISQSGRQCIIETHSEHIINALRHRIAITQSPYDEKLAGDIQIYFSTKNNGKTEFKPINIDKYSAMTEWPEDFFDESQVVRKEIIALVSEKLEKDSQDE